MSKYFKGVGYLELISFVIVVIWYLIANIIMPASEAFKTTEGTLSWISSFSTWIIFLIVGPALGLLFVSYGKRIESAPVRYVTAKVTHYDDAGNAISSPNGETAINASMVNVARSNPDISEIHYGSGTLTINRHTINAEYSKIYDLSMSENEICFSVDGNKYAFSYSDPEKAKELYDYLEKYKAN